MGENGGTKLQNVLLAENSSAYATSSADYTAEAEEYADVVIEDGECYFDYFDDIKESASKLLSTGIKWGFGPFPIKKGAFKKGIISTHVTEKNICNALLRGPNVDESNHNKKRNKLKKQRVKPNEAWEMGVSADRIQVKKACPKDFDWENSPVYAGVSSCEDVWDEINGHGVPAVMYAVNMESAAARTYIDKMSTAPLYTKYSSDPVQCGSGTEVESGKKFKDTFNDLPLVEFIIRSYWGKRWSAWNHRNSCDEYDATNLKFSFGTRVFVPITVDEGDGPVDKTIVISSIATVPNMTVTDMFGWVIPEDLPYERFVGAETAKKVLMDAKGWGWDIE